jgi:dihydrolipoamide dehydrogenase
LASSISTDIAVIGAGTAGSLAFREITRAGKSALLIDRGPLGTTCARVGCMPSKAVLHAAHDWAAARAHGTAGDPAGAQALWARARATRDMLAAGAAQRTRSAAGERLVMGQARFVGPNTLDVDGQRIEARAFVVATGSRPVVPAWLAALGDRVLTTDTLFELESLPRSVGILGLGAIGLEMGLALARLGVRVVGADLQDTVAGISDPAVRDRAVQRLGREFPMWLGRSVQVERAGGDVVMLSGTHRETVEMVLAALGRRPNLESLDLEQAGVALDDAGRAAVDGASLRAGGSCVFVAGDAHADRPLMHEAADEGTIAARGALALLDGRTADLSPRRERISIVFSDPDIVAVGMSFDQIDPAQTVIGTAEGSGNGRSRILDATENLVRVYAQRGSGVLLGASVIATRGEHLAHLLAWAVQRRETVAGLLRMPFYHPSIEEMVQSALGDAAGRLDG